MNNTFIKILIVTEFYPSTINGDITGGVEARVFHLSQRLAQKGHQVSIVTTRRPGQSHTATVGSVQVQRCGLPYVYSHTGHIFARLSFVFHALFAGRQFPVDIVEGSSFLTYPVARILGLMRRVPSVYTYHECWIGSWIRLKGILTGVLGEIWERLVLTLFPPAIIAVSHSTKLQLREKTGIIATAVVPNGVDVSQCQKIKVRQQKPLQIVTVSRLIPEKKVDVLVRAFARIKHAHPTATLLIIGEGTEKKSLQQLARDLHCETSIMFAGKVTSAHDVLKRIKESVLFCLPSVREGFGIVVTEAMACGIPVLCSDIPSLREISNNGTAAMLMTPDSVDDCARKLRRLLADQHIRKQLMLEGSRCVETYNWNTIVQQYELTLRRLL